MTPSQAARIATLWFEAVAEVPVAPAGTRLRRGISAGEIVFIAERPAFASGCAWGYEYVEAGNGRRTWIVVDITGLAPIPGAFSRKRAAIRFCKAWGRCEAYFKRATCGDARAGMALARLCRTYRRLQ